MTPLQSDYPSWHSFNVGKPHLYYLYHMVTLSSFQVSEILTHTNSLFYVEGRTDQRNAQINFSLINLLLFNYSDMFRLLNWSHPQGV